MRSPARRSALRVAMLRVEVERRCGWWIPAEPAAGGWARSTSPPRPRSSWPAPACPVAKHGNRSYTSRCGSADVLEALGVDIELIAGAARRRCSRAAGLVFLFAPTYHPAMRHVGPVRRGAGRRHHHEPARPAGESGRRHAPGGRRLGCARGRRSWPRRSRGSGAAHALVLHAAVGMDEISPSGRDASVGGAGWGVRRVGARAGALGLGLRRPG